MANVSATSLPCFDDISGFSFSSNLDTKPLKFRISHILDGTCGLKREQSSLCDFGLDVQVP